jgi:hypothetical protein
MSLRARVLAFTPLLALVGGWNGWLARVRHERRVD